MGGFFAKMTEDKKEETSNIFDNFNYQLILKDSNLKCLRRNISDIKSEQRRFYDSMSSLSS